MSILHYPGDCSDAVENCMKPMGPDTAGAHWVPMTAEYDPVADRTTVTLKSGTFERMLKEIWERRRALKQSP